MNRLMLCLLVVLLGCGGASFEAASVGSDAGVDTVVDEAVLAETEPDAATVVGPDAVLDAVADAGHDVDPETGEDVATGLPDAGMIDTKMDAPEPCEKYYEVRCGATCSRLDADPKNCGACGVVCDGPAGGSCSQSKCYENLPNGCAPWVPKICLINGVKTCVGNGFEPCQGGT